MNNPEYTQREHNILTLIYLIYLFLMYYVIVHQFPVALEASYNGLLYPYEFKLGSAVVASVISFILLLFIRKYYLNLNNISNTVILLLILLYFIPGLFVCCVTKIPKLYLISYIIFIFLFIFFDRCIKIDKKIKILKIKNNMPLFFIYGIITVTTIFILFFRQEFSLGRFLLALTDVYEVRADAEYFHWFIYNIELWAVYFGAIMIVYCLRTSKKIYALIIVLCELFFFSMQANKIDLFVTIMAIVCGIKKNINKKEIAIAFVFLAMFIFVECLFFDRGLIVTNIFRRYSIVPNRISSLYFDFFQTHEPDLLRTPFNRVASFLGQTSPYSNIARTIGQAYYGTEMGANTGMMASGLFLFGNMGILVEAFCIPFFLKLFNFCTKGIKNTSLIALISIVLVTLIINAPYPLSNLFRITYFLFLFISLYLCRSAFSEI